MLKLFLILLLAAATYSQTIPAPYADHHQHVGSQSMAEFLKFPNALTAKDVIALLDTAGIEKGVLLSIAYAYGRPGREPQN
jgi:hypothetical protein